MATKMPARAVVASCQRDSFGFPGGRRIPAQNVYRNTPKGPILPTRKTLLNMLKAAILRIAAATSPAVQIDRIMRAGSFLLLAAPATAGLGKEADSIQAP